MAPFFEDKSLSIGNTPLVKINRMAAHGKATVLAKIEGRNPAYSVKCRIGAGMIWEAEKAGLLRPGMEIVEPTSGNTGIALAFVSAARGYRLTVTMPETVSMERRKVLTARKKQCTPAGLWPCSTKSAKKPRIVKGDTCARSMIARASQ